MQTFERGEHVFVANMYNMRPTPGRVVSGLKKCEESPDQYYLIEVIEQGTPTQLPFMPFYIYRNEPTCQDAIYKLIRNGFTSRRAFSC